MSTTIGQYLIRQLGDHGVRHVFGVPGDYSLLFIQELNKSPLAFINTADEQGAGFAADAYARLGRLGAVCVTYSVGSLKVANAAAQAHAERSPLVIIVGSPGLAEREKHPLLHHRVNQFDTQLKIFRELTVASAALHDPQTACDEIDRCLHAAERHKRPVYIELPRDMVHSQCDASHCHVDLPDVSDEGALAEAAGEAAEMIRSARRPVVVAGEEIKRFGLQGPLLELVRRNNLPVAATLLGKSAVREDLPQFVGVYAGALSCEETCRFVESCDCFILLGMMMTDLNLGVFTAHMDRSRTILANLQGVSIKHHQYGVRMAHFISALLGQSLGERELGTLPPRPMSGNFAAVPGAAITNRRLFQKINEYIADDMVVLADVGDSLFGGIDLVIRNEGRFLSCAYYTNMGSSVPGSVGAQLLDRKLRPLVLVGDGAFQMTGLELSTAARYGLSPIVVVLNNGGYATERFFLDGAFNDLQPWRFSRVPDLLGAGKGFLARTEDELEAALAAAKANTGSFSIIDVILDPGDVSDGLKRLGVGFGKSVRG